MKIGLIGEDDVAAGFHRQLAVTNFEITERSARSIQSTDDVIVLTPGALGELEVVNSSICETKQSLLLVQPEGVGSATLPDVTFSITLLSGAGPCLNCLNHRLAAAGAEESAQESRIQHRSVAQFAGVMAAHLLSSQPTREGGWIWTWPYSERRVWPIPGCAECDPHATDRWAPPPTEGTSRSLAEALSKAEESIDRHVGIVTEIGEVASYPAPYYLAVVGDTAGFSDVEAPRHAAGLSHDWNVAYMKAVGEGLERYAAGVYREDWMTVGHPEDIEGAIHPDRFVRPDTWGEVTEPIPWIPGESLQTGEHCYLPAETCVFPPPSRQIRPAITTGLGLGNTGQEAILSGLLEVIERDACMLAWYSSFEPLGISVDTDAYNELAPRVQSEGLEISTVLLTQDIDIPVIAVAVHRDDKWPRIALGSAAAIDPADAAISALCEAIQNWRELSDIGESRADETSGWIGQYAANPTNVRQFFDVEGGVDVQQLSDQSNRDPLELVKERVVAAGLEAYVAWLTPRDIRSLGFEAVRVVIPEAQPLFIDTPYFGKRLETVPPSLGFEQHPTGDPHPFP